MLCISILVKSKISKKKMRENHVESVFVHVGSVGDHFKVKMIWKNHTQQSQLNILKPCSSLNKPGSHLICRLFLYTKIPQSPEGKFTFISCKFKAIASSNSLKQKGVKESFVSKKRRCSMLGTRLLVPVRKLPLRLSDVWRSCCDWDWEWS